MLSHPRISDGKILVIHKIHSASGVAQAQATPDIKKWTTVSISKVLVFDKTSSKSGWENRGTELLADCQ